jgi:hypothetical protein
MTSWPRSRKADAYPGEGYDLVAVFDALHSMTDPLAAAAHIRRSLADDGTFLLAKAGFGRVRRATETPFNRVFEARL